MAKLKIKDIQNLKGKRKITKVTALNYYSARAIEESDIDIIGLDGPPVEMYFKGEKDGLKANLDELILCLKAVRRGAENTFIVAPIPFIWSQGSIGKIYGAAKRLMEEGADAVKIEGAGKGIDKIKKVISDGIPCVGTVGHSQEIYQKEGFRCIGKKAPEAVKAYEDAKILQELGVIWIEIECMPFKVASEITKSLKIPTIGIGSGAGCDGQFLHSEDILGMLDSYYPKHCKKYMDFYPDSIAALSDFRMDVISGRFPKEENSFVIDEEEFAGFKKKLEKK
jgi:3-methyl-2-oxobutanoate hydroxymethyltransferase